MGGDRVAVKYVGTQKAGSVARGPLVPLGFGHVADDTEFVLFTWGTILRRRAVPSRAGAAPRMDQTEYALTFACYGQLDYTRQCIESMVRHGTPLERLVVVDNGSEGGPPPYPSHP